MTANSIGADTVLRIGTRTSRLALWQTARIAALLAIHFPHLRFVTVPIVTEGDRNLAASLPALGGKGVFTADLEERLRSGEIDMAVHSLKDLPVEAPDGITVAAICDRTDVRDGLVANQAWTLATLPQGALLGTCSLRREAQVRMLRPDLVVRQIRGNVPSRIEKVRRGDFDATILAAAGLLRLGLVHETTQWFTLDEMLPAPGQGALAVECRDGDAATHALLSAIDSETDRAATSAERHFLQALGGGCSAPVAAYASIDDGGALSLSGLVASVDGVRSVRVAGRVSHMRDALALAEDLAHQALRQGAKEIIDGN